MEQAGVQLVAQNADVYISNLKAAEKATLGFVDATDSGSGRVSGAGQVMIGALRKVGAVAVEAFGQALRAGADFIGDSINLAGDFEQTMSVLGAVSGATGEELDAVAAKAKELGGDLSLPATSAVDAGEAMLELAKAGFNVQQSMDAAKGVLQLAAAAQIDEAKAAEISSNAINAFGLEAKDALFVSDLLAASANASSVEITDVAASYQMAGAIFSNFQGPVVGSKQALVDLTTAIGILGNAGIKGSDAGTSLKQALLQLTAPSDKAKGLMHDLAADIGVAGDIAYTASGQMRSFPEIIGLVAASTKNLSEEQRNYIISTIFGADATRAIITLMNEGPAAWDAMSTAVTRQGAAADLAAAQTAGYKGAIEGAKSQIETLQLTIGQYLTPVLADLINTYISPGIAAFTSWAESILSANDPLQALVTSIDSIVPGFQDFLTAAQSLVTILGDNLDVILGVAAAFGSFAIISTVVGWVTSLIGTITALSAAATAAGGGLAGIVAILGGPVTLTIAAVAAAVGVFAIAWQNNWGGIQEKTASVVKVLSDLWTGTLQPALKQVWQFLQDKVFPVLSDLADVYIAAAIIEVEALASIWTNVLWPALKAVGSFISGVILPIMGALFNVAFAIAKKEVEALAGLWQKVLQPALKAVGDYISGTVIPTFQKIGSYLSATFGPILEDVTAWLNDVTGGFEGISGAVQGAIDWLNGLADSISNLKLPDWLQVHSPTPFETGLRGIGDALQKSVGPGMKAFTGELSTIGEAFTNSELVDQLSQLGEDMMAGLGEGIRYGVRGVIRIINSTSDTVTGAFQDNFNIGSPSRRIFDDVGVPIMLGLMDGIESLVPAMINVVDSVGSAMINALTKNKEAMGDEIRAVMDDLKDQATSLAMDINGAIADGFGATASIERQIAKNLDRFKDIPDQYRDFTTGALREAQQQATQFLDPAQQAKFFKMRSDQILEYAKLQKQLDEETDSGQRVRLQEQMAFINRAQQNEIRAFQAETKSQLAPMQQIQADLQKFLATNVELSNGTAFTLPGLLENSTINGLTTLFQQLSQMSTANPYFESYANPPMSSQQMAYGGNSTTYNGQRTYNMPIYTNQSPAAIQQSMAITEAMYP